MEPCGNGRRLLRTGLCAVHRTALGLCRHDEHIAPVIVVWYWRGCALGDRRIRLHGPVHPVGGAEPAVGALLLVSGLWTLNFPAAAGALKISLFATCAFMALYILVTAVAMECRGVGRWMVQVAVAVAVLLAAFAGLFGLFGTAGMLPAFALALYVAAWGFVYAAVSLSVSGGVEGARG